jgi:MFS family permease
MGIPTPSQIGLIVSLMLLGAFTSNLFVGYMAGMYLPYLLTFSSPFRTSQPTLGRRPCSLLTCCPDHLGRRRSILAGCLVFFIGGALQTSAKAIGWMFAGRFLAGLGIGMLAMLAPLYQSEIAHPSVRGRLTSMQQLFMGVSTRATPSSTG